MKPLTIEQLKALEVGDWVWVIQVGNDKSGGYMTISAINQKAYSHYGKEWLAYKNKEQAETKGEIVEFPYLDSHFDNLGFGTIFYREHYTGTVEREMYFNKTEAERRISELKGEKQ